MGRMLKKTLCMATTLLPGTQW